MDPCSPITTEINIIGSSLITVGNSESTVSEILLDYYYSETQSSYRYIIYTATKWQKMKREQTEDDSQSALNIFVFNNNRVQN